MDLDFRVVLEHLDPAFFTRRLKLVRHADAARDLSPAWVDDAWICPDGSCIVFSVRSIGDSTAPGIDPLASKLGIFNLGMDVADRVQIHSAEVHGLLRFRGFCRQGDLDGAFRAR